MGYKKMELVITKWNETNKKTKNPFKTNHYSNAQVKKAQRIYKPYTKTNTINHTQMKPSVGYPKRKHVEVKIKSEKKYHKVFNCHFFSLYLHINNNQ